MRYLITLLLFFSAQQALAQYRPPTRYLGFSGGPLTSPLYLDANKLYFDSDRDTYCFASADDTIQCWIGPTPTQVWTWTASANTSLVPMLVAPGAASAPSYSFSGATNYGHTLIGGTQVQTVINGTARWVVSSSSVSPNLVPLNMATQRVYDSLGALQLGNAPTIGHGGLTGSVAIGKDAGGVSLEVDGESYFDDDIWMSGSKFCLDFDGDCNTYIQSREANRVEHYAGNALIYRVDSNQLVLNQRLVPGGAGPILVGGAGSTSHGLTGAAGDVLAFHDLEVDGTFYADGAGIFGSQVRLNDGVPINYGGSNKYWMQYVAGSTQFQFKSTNVDGGGTDGNIFTVDDGTDDVDFTGIVTAPDFIVDGGYAVDYTIKGGSAVLGPTAPTFAVNNSVTGLAFDAVAETVGIDFEVPDCWDGTSDLTFKIYWVAESGDVPQLNEVVIFDILYRSIDWNTEDTDNGTVANGTVTYTELSDPGDDNDTHESMITIDFDHADQPIAAGDTIAIIFNRDTAAEAGSGYSGDAIVNHWEMAVNQSSLVCNHH